MVEKLEFNISFDGTQTLENLKLEVKVNGELTKDYKYDELNIYKVDAETSACNVNNNQKVLNNYTLKENESYIFEIKEFSVNNKELSSGLWQSEGYVFINGTDIAEFNHFCMGTQKEEGKSETFAFSTPAGLIKNTEEELVVQNNDQINDEVQNETLISTNEQSVDNSIFNNEIILPIMGGIIGILIIVIVILITKMKKNKQAPINQNINTNQTIM